MTSADASACGAALYPLAHLTLRRITPHRKHGERVVTFAPYTAVLNATGQPAMSVPLFWNKDGLPIGSHFVGRFGDEATLFRLAAQLEQARPWATRRPVFAHEGVSG